MLVSFVRAASRRAASSSSILRSTLRDARGREAFGSPVVVVVVAERGYRGESGEMTPRPLDKDAVGLREAALLDVAAPRYEEILARHVALPDVDRVPRASLGDETTTTTTTETTNDGIRRKRLVYRSKQRGWLEVDLLLGAWASENVPRLNVAELDEFEAFVNLETIDIYNVLTLRTDAPAEFRNSAVVSRLQEWAKQSPLGKADPAAYERAKRSNNLI